MPLNRSKWVAVVAGVLAIALSIGYLFLVQLLDFRGDFQPAPIGIAIRLQMSVCGW